MSELKQTDLSKRLREIVENQEVDSISYLKDHIDSAADEIERYYTSMLNWKATAEAQSTQPEATKDDSLRTSLADLAMALWRTHYRNDSPNFELLPDPAGILSQIDNMVSGLVKPEATKPAQDLGERNTQGPLLIARIKRYRDVFGCTLKEAKEAVEYGRDLNSDQTAFVSPPKKDSTLARQIIRDTNDTLREQYEALVQLKAENDQLRAALASPADALVAGDRVDALEQVHKFLMGEAPLDGYWFGENSMEVQGIYWWRTKLRAAIQAQKDGHG